MGGENHLAQLMTSLKCNSGAESYPPGTLICLQIASHPYSASRCSLENMSRLLHSLRSHPVQRSSRGRHRAVLALPPSPRALKCNQWPTIPRLSRSINLGSPLLPITSPSYPILKHQGERYSLFTRWVPQYSLLPFLSRQLLLMQEQW